MRLFKFQLIAPLWSMMAAVTLFPQATFLPSTMATSLFTATNVSVGFINLDATIKNNRIILNWAIDQNEEASGFEIERSISGGAFVPVGLVFTTDRTGKEEYSFYERKNDNGASYRIKIIQKNGQFICSPTILIDKKGNIKKLPEK